MSAVWRMVASIKDILYGELALGRRTTGCPQLRYKDVCVRDTKAVDIDTTSWEGLAADRTQSGGVPWHNISRQGKTNWWLQQWTWLLRQRLSLPLRPALVSSATLDGATAKQGITKILVFITHGWSSLTWLVTFTQSWSQIIFSF